MRTEVGTIPGTKAGNGLGRSGFISTGLGAHSSRTIMLHELRLLMSVTAGDLAPEDYRQAICDKNVLQKRTDATRRESFRRLREMYGLDPRLRVFRALRDLWSHDAEAQPLLAVLCACTRDPILKSTAKFIIKTQQGDRVDADMISEHVLHDVGDHLNRMTLGEVTHGPLGNNCLRESILKEKGAGKRSRLLSKPVPSG